jgi:hypothetical protein
MAAGAGTASNDAQPRPVDAPPSVRCHRRLTGDATVNHELDYLNVVRVEIKQHCPAGRRKAEAGDARYQGRQQDMRHRDSALLTRGEQAEQPQNDEASPPRIKYRRARQLTP